MSDPCQEGDSGRLAAGAEAPLFPVRTVASTRSDHGIGAVTLGEFERELAEVAWFAHLGEPSPWDDGCVRIFGWEQWPGPGSELVLEFALVDRVYAVMVSRAGAAVPSCDPRQDAWHASAQCAWDAGYVAALTACVLSCGWPVPEDLAEVWNWYQAGHWPSGFTPAAGNPGGTDAEALDSPRRLLVY
jgi:hypothetical protein